jgi:adenine-specific DNA-methyltransferase
VTEDTPLDVEVAIDPEMLGKIFESLILQLEKDPDKDLRKLTGSYYTPRPIVHFMCQEALKEYLVTQLAGEDTKKAGTVREKMTTLLSLPPADQLDEEQVETLHALFTPPEAKTLRQAILDCRICDPAVGSGAFPVGMLHEMVAAAARLDLRLSGPGVLKRRNYDYDLKKQIIESCLYGVDIQEQAVRLCELRLWLSLVVDYQVDQNKPFARAIREVPSLPNLSYHIMRGDSLLERLFGHVVQLDQMARDAKTHRIIGSIQADKMSYFREGKTTEKRRLELKILAKQADLTERLIEAKLASMLMYQPSLLGDDNLKAKERKVKEQNQALRAEMTDLKAKVARAKTELDRLSRQKGTVNRGDLDTLRHKYFQSGDAPTFVWHVDFAEVFEERDGFDVMIANPPYVRADKGANHLVVRSEILTSGFYETLWEKWDLYVPFIERAYKMLRPNGVLEFITSDAYCHAKYAQRSQEWFLKNALVRRLDFVSNLQIFEAGVRNVLFCYRRADGRNNVPLRIRHQGEFGSVVSLPSSLQQEATYRLFQPDSHEQAANIIIETVPLEKLCYISKGAVVHAEERRYRGEFKLEDLVQDYSDKQHSKMFVEGKDLSRWFVKRIRCIEWGTRRAPDHFSRPTFPELYAVKEKLISVDMAAGAAKLKVAYDNTQIFHNHSAWSFVPWHLLKGVRNRSITKSAKYNDETEAELSEYREDLEELSRRFNLKYILAVMNSSWARDYLRSRRRSNIHLYPDDWKPLPIPIVSRDIQDVIAGKVDEILKALKKGQNIGKLEEEVDTMISELYSGSAEFRRIVAHESRHEREIANNLDRATPSL